MRKLRSRNECLIIVYNTGYLSRANEIYMYNSYEVVNETSGVVK